jgi:membrane glycosyltransferase
MLPRSELDNPETAVRAWARYRRLMRFMLAVTIGTVLLSFAVLYHFNGLVSIHLYIATALGVGFAMLLMSALMGLVFLSSGTGHDEATGSPEDQGNDERG